VVDLESLLTDLADESTELDALVGPLPAAGWARPTPAPGWTIAHQIAHLAWTDHVARLAATDVDAFFASIAHAATDPTGFVDRGAEEFLARVGVGQAPQAPATPRTGTARVGVGQAPQAPATPRTGTAPPAELLARWRAGRSALADALARVPPGDKLPWYGTQMSPASMVTARIMETWAHGQDVADTLGVTRTPTGRLRHVAHLGTRTLAHGFAAHARAAPDQPVRVELTAPDGAVWAYGPADAVNTVSGPALDFCLLVTQRRHRADLALVATGPVADEWLDVAQAFAGPPGAGRQPGAKATL
jgi:uncharacterized protein (TIGR03084 family)